MAYVKQTWLDDDESTALTAERMQHIEDGIYDTSVTVGEGAPDATTIIKGKIKLAGDLSGTADIPTVPSAVKLTGAQTIAGVKTFSSAPIVPTPTAGNEATNKDYVDNQTSSGSVPDATSSVSGKIRLTGDLGGTATAPTTPTAVHLTGNESVAGIKTFASSPIVPDPTTAQQAASKAYVDANGGGGSTPDATSSVKGKIQLAGDLAGSAAAPTVPSAVKLTGAQTVAGVKTFSSAPVVPDDSFVQAKVVGLVTALNNLAVAIADLNTVVGGHTTTIAAHTAAIAALDVTAINDTLTNLTNRVLALESYGANAVIIKGATSARVNQMDGSSLSPESVVIWDVDGTTVTNAQNDDLILDRTTL
jgi:hypothetical protein